MRRSVGAYAVVLVVLATVVGCSDDDSGARDPVTTTATGSGSTPTTDAGSTGPEVEAGTSKDWACPEVAAVEAPAQVRCVQVTVAERTGVDGGGPVVLPVAVVTHPGQSAATPLVYLDGGPGGDAIGVTADLAALPFAAGRPVVVIGQRGTPFAQPSLDCPEIEKSEIGQLDDALDDATDAAYLDAVGACFERVQAGGADLATFDTAQAADDLESVRLALGYDTWDVLGTSYGTTLALALLRQHPAAIRSVVLDSVYPPDVESYATLPAGAQRAMREVVAACGEDPECAPISPTMLERLDRLYDKLEATPFDATSNDPVTGDPVTVRWDGTRLAQALFGAMHSPAIIALLPGLLASLERGDFALTTSYYLDYEQRDRDSFAEGLYFAVECRERAPFSDPGEVSDAMGAAPEWVADAVTAEASLQECDHWTAAPVKAQAGPVTSDVPALVLAGRFDPVTPPAWGEHVAETLSASTVVQVATGGHVVSFDPCGASIVASFLDNPGGTPDTSCAEDRTIAWSIS